MWHSLHISPDEYGCRQPKSVSKRIRLVASLLFQSIMCQSVMLEAHAGGIAGLMSMCAEAVSCLLHASLLNYCEVFAVRHCLTNGANKAAALLAALLPFFAAKSVRC